jgi:acetyl-CoA carboxylase biotin carboxyl carrier protein
MADDAPISGDVFDVDRITRLIELMKAHDLAEVNLKQGEQQIQLKRGGAVPAMPALAAAPPPLAGSAPAPPPPLPREADQVADKNIVEIKSPMVGTFYTKPSPDADNFVKVGDHIEPDTTICIVEAMKVFNEIAAEISGQVVAILVENEEPVEFGMPLFKVDISK